MALRRGFEAPRHRRAQANPLWPCLAVAIALFAGAATAAERLPIFDAHIHYNRDAWEAYEPDKVIELLDAAGVPRALVSSTPDDGTLMLFEAAPDRVVPILRPYRSSRDRADWFENPEIVT